MNAFFCLECDAHFEADSGDLECPECGSSSVVEDDEPIEVERSEDDD